uniref:Uncharacterized protein n=1 Tax=Arundo donax TaxID=35708 RepID=A0A0A8YJ84_ARUDO
MCDAKPTIGDLVNQFSLHMRHGLDLIFMLFLCNLA